MVWGFALKLGQGLVTVSVGFSLFYVFKLVMERLFVWQVTVILEDNAGIRNNSDWMLTEAAADF